MDRLSALLNLFQPETQSVDQICLTDQSPLSYPDTGQGCLYLIQSGALILTSDSLAIHQRHQSGDLLWLPRGNAHHLAADGLGSDGLETDDLEKKCVVTRIVIHFVNQELNLLQNTLPGLLNLPTEDSQAASLKPLVQLMCQEAGQQRCGHTTVVNRLAEVLLVTLLRYLMAERKVDTGILGGLSDIRLAKALTGIHDNPGQSWNLEQLAQTAGMSRTSFSQQFRATVGFTPADYLAQWRMSLACKKIRRGQTSIATLADELGYQSETAFRRAFRKITGHPPGFFKHPANDAQMLEAEKMEI